MLATRPSLLERLRNPADSTSWEEFVRLYTPLLLHWGRQLGDADPDDSVQDLFIVLVKKLPDFQYDANRYFRAWLKTILKRIIVKKMGPRPGPLYEEVLVPDPMTDLEDAEALKHLLGRVFGLIRVEFEDNTWKSFWECVVNDRAAADVAQELGVTPGAVWVNVARVRARLRTRFAEYLDYLN